MPVYHYIPVCLLLITVIVISIKAEKLTILAAITGGIVGMLIFGGADYTGLTMLGTFFIMGTLATWWKKEEKLQFKPVADRSSKRNTGQVLANGGMAAICGLLVYLIPEKIGIFRLMMAASLASAMADTLSSELGMVYGRRFYHILTWKKDEKGLDGVISLEGTMIGVAGSVIIAVIYAVGFGWGGFLVIIAAGTIGNLADSVLGAVLERRHYLGNNAVNFLNTFIAASAAALLFNLSCYV